MVITVIGFTLLPRLSLRLNPSHRGLSLSVTCLYYNASPKQIESEITRPLEAAFSTFSDITSISSVSYRGQSSITVNIADKSKLDLIRFDLSSTIRRIYPSLPVGAGYPTIRQNQADQESSKRPILTYSLFASLDRAAIYQYASEHLAPQLSMIDGLFTIEVSGGNSLEWQIHYDQTKLDQYQISISDLRHSISYSLRDEALGIAHQSGLDYYSFLSSKSLSELEYLVIDTIGGLPILLQDIASITKAEAKEQFIYRVNGKNNIRLRFIPETTANHIVLAEQIKAQIQSFNLDQSYSIIKDYDSTEYLKVELDKIKMRSIWSLGLLFLFVMIAYRRISHLTIIGLGLFINMGISFIFYYLCEVQLNLYALAAITVSFGIIIDNMIVVIHHYRQYHDLKVAPALLSSTLTTLASLIVIWFLPERWQWSLIDFAKVMAINLSVSLAVSIFVIPALVDQFFKNHEEIRFPKFKTKLLDIYSILMSKLLKYRIIAWIAVILAFGLPVFLLPNHIKNWDWYNHSFGSDWYIENAKPYVNKGLGGSLRLFMHYVYEGSSFRENEETKLYVNASLPLGSTLEQMDELLQKMEQYLQQYKSNIKHYLTNIHNPENGSISITFADRDASFPFILKSRLQSFAVNLGGVEWQIYGIGRGFSNASGSSPARFRTMMKGYNKDQLEKLAEDFAQLLTEHPRIKNVDPQANINWWEKDQKELVLALDKTKMMNKDFAFSDLQDVLDHFNQDRTAMGYTQNNLGVSLVNNKRETNDLWKLNHSYFQKDSSQILFGSIGHIQIHDVQSNIHKKDQQYLQLLEWEYLGSGRFGQKYLEECISTFSPTLPLGYSIEQNQYSYFNQAEKKKQYSLLLLIVAIIFLICAVHFESILTSISVVLLIPISFIGIFLTFYFFDFPFDQGGYTSFLLVSGIVVNGIILILSDFKRLANQNKKGGQLSYFVQAVAQKATPIFLSTFSTVFGLLPFTMHGAQEPFWFALAVGTIGGLLFSLIVIFLIAPLSLK